MEGDKRFHYYYGKETEIYTFYRIPKRLITDPMFRILSSDAKILYGLMLDRLSLSIRNDWIDEKGRVYIFYSIEDIMENLNCGKNKAVRALAELDHVEGIGLIEKVRQGQGKPNIIYVKNFTNEVCSEVSKVNFKKSPNETSRSPKSKLQEVSFEGSNKNNSVATLSA